MFLLFLENISDLGIKGNHAFTIVRAIEIPPFQLICIRNPWGSYKEETGINNLPGDRWKGPFSRYSNDWTKEMLEIVKPELENNDGTFWMRFEDFTDYFCSASICHLCLPQFGFREFRISSNIIYTYDENSNSENITYPQFILTVNGSVNQSLDLVWIGIHQPDLRSQFTTYVEYLDCCILIAKLPEDEKYINNPLFLEPIAITQCRKSRSEFQQIFSKLDDGKYLFIPYTTGIVFHKNYQNLKQIQRRNINVSLFIRSNNEKSIDENIFLSFEKHQKSIDLKQIRNIFIQFMEVLFVEICLNLVLIFFSYIYLFLFFRDWEEVQLKMEYNLWRQALEHFLYQ